MAHAYKCDRCGKLFEINIITYENFPEHKIERRSGTQIDLCGKCQKALSCFLEMKTYSPDEVFTKIIIHGQGDMKFAPHETIKYSPTEIEKILMKDDKQGDDE